MDYYLNLVGYAGSSRRKGHVGWLPVESFEFQRPTLRKDTAEFQVSRQQDALSSVLSRRAADRQPFRHVRVHAVEGSEVVFRLLFEDVVVSSYTIDGQTLEKESLGFDAARWEIETA